MRTSSLIAIFSFLFLLLFMPLQTAWALDKPAGVVVALDGVAYAEQDGVERTLELKSHVYPGETLITAEEGRITVVFSDKSRLTLESSSRVALERYLFGPTRQGALLRMGEGVFRVVTGKIVEQNPEDFVMETPLAVIGIRGTTVGIVVRAQTETIFAASLQTGRTVWVSNRNLPDVPSTLTTPNTGVDVTPDQPPSPPRPVEPTETPYVEEQPFTNQIEDEEEVVGDLEAEAQVDDEEAEDETAEEVMDEGGADTDPADTDPADTDPADTDPADTDQADTLPTDTPTTDMPTTDMPAADTPQTQAPAPAPGSPPTPRAPAPSPPPRDDNPASPI